MSTNLYFQSTLLQRNTGIAMHLCTYLSIWNDWCVCHYAIIKNEESHEDNFEINCPFPISTLHLLQVNTNFSNFFTKILFPYQQLRWINYILYFAFVQNWQIIFVIKSDLVKDLVVILILRLTLLQRMLLCCFLYLVSLKWSTPQTGKEERGERDALSRILNLKE